jgi:hypothetical protein
MPWDIHAILFNIEYIFTPEKYIVFEMNFNTLIKLRQCHFETALVIKDELTGQNNTII